MFIIRPKLSKNQPDYHMAIAKFEKDKLICFENSYTITDNTN